MKRLPGQNSPRIAFVLRWGSYLSAVFLLVGLVWVMAAPDVPIQAGPPMPLNAIGGQLISANPYAVMQLGILLLLATPLTRVVMASVSFWLGGERRYSLMSLAVLAIIVVTILLAQRA
ncbi:MAG: DUF1634 domain-containing protein [Planctomycetota bacterium]|jgi:uncharacterized membrane protein